MDWASSIERNRVALVNIVAALVAMLGDGGGLPAQVRAAVLGILQPAEAAVRRLIVVVAGRIVVKPAAARPMPKGIAWSRGAAAAGRTSVPRFALSDPMPPVQVSEPPAPRFGPRITSISPWDPTVPALWAARRAATRVARKLATPVNTGHDAARLALRVQAISYALEDLPRQARRLLRWKSRRQRLSEQRFLYTEPLRSGPPPAHRAPPGHHVSQVLTDCHHLVFEARFDTS